MNIIDYEEYLEERIQILDTLLKEEKKKRNTLLILIGISTILAIILCILLLIKDELIYYVCDCACILITIIFLILESIEERKVNKISVIYYSYKFLKENCDLIEQE